MEWIVIASGAHTLNLKSVIARYPDAKVIGPPQAEDKLKFVSALPRGKVDFDSTKPDHLSAANALLEPEGVTLFDITGDKIANALVAVFEESQLMACDLLYTRLDGSFLTIDKERFEKFLPEDWFMRLFRYTTTGRPNSPHGVLPGYRYQRMDPNSLGAMMYDPPASDGSSCKIMAGSLRRIIKARFDYANGVHFDQMKKEDFAKNLDNSWRWLDGHPMDRMN